MAITENGIRKTAFLIDLLGRELIKDILNEMDRGVIARITAFDAESQNLTIYEATNILQEFIRVSKILVDSKVGTTSLLHEFDESRTSKSPDYLARKKYIGFVKLDEKPVEQIYEVLKNESTMYKVVYLRQLSESNATAVFHMLPPEEKVKFAIESESSGETPHEVLEEISNYLHDRLDEKLSDKQSNYDAMITLACSLGEAELNELLASLPKNIAEDVRANVVTFTDVLSQTEDILQQIVATFDAETLGLAACAESDEVKSKLLSCVSATKRGDVEDVFTDSDVNDIKAQEAAKRPIVALAKQLNDNGTIELVK